MFLVESSFYFLSNLPQYLLCIIFIRTFSFHFKLKLEKGIKLNLSINLSPEHKKIINHVGLAAVRINSWNSSGFNNLPNGALAK